jgi:hypothetical protein
MWSSATDTYDGTHPNARGEYIIAKAMADTLSARFGYGGPFGAIPLAPPPPKPVHVVVTPGTIHRDHPFTVTWDRVVNPGIWTEYRLQVRYHQAFGYGLVWESPGTTPTLSMTYTGPPLPQTGTFHVVVVAHDIYGQDTMSDPVPLVVTDIPLPPPPPSNVQVTPGLIGRDGGFVATWDRVFNPGVWTEYKVQLRYHQAFGFGLVWESSGTTPGLTLTYDGPRLPQAGTFHVVVVARDIYGQETMSAPVPLDVQERVPPPLPPQNIRVSPGVVWRSGGFTVEWDRVVNPKVWTEYEVQLRYHQAFGFGLVWRTANTTPGLSVTYDGPLLPQAGVYHVVVVARDVYGQSTMSAPVPLEVRDDPPAPLPPQNVRVFPNTITRTGTFVVAWDRVTNPGIWTEYKVQLRNHQAFGFGLVWETAGTTPGLSASYTGPALANGVYHVVVVARDQFGQETMSVPVPLTVMNRPAPPPPPRNIQLLPGTIPRNGSFTAVWDRVTNPGIWTDYRMQVRYHQAFGFGLVWQSPASAEVSARYAGPMLPQAGVFHVVIVARDVFGQETMSAPIALTVTP